MNNNERSKRNFSGRFPGTGGASMGAYRSWAIDEEETEGRDDDDEIVADETERGRVAAAAFGWDVS